LRQEAVTSLVLLVGVFAGSVDKDGEVAVQHLKGEAIAVLKLDKDHFQNGLVDYREDIRNWSCEKDSKFRKITF